MSKIIEQVKTYEDAVAILAPDPELLPFLNYEGDNLELIGIRDQKKVEHIIKVLNEGWIADLTNDGEWRYYPWFEVSGSGLSCHAYVSDCSDSNVGSRLCLRSGELARYVGQQFIDLYNSFMVVPVK
jgi:hypothetical protein